MKADQLVGEAGGEDISSRLRNETHQLGRELLEVHFNKKVPK
jgi:hypothetical protein